VNDDVVKSLMVAALAAAGAYLLVRAYKQNTHKPASAMVPVTGVLGNNPVLSPVGAKTTGDFTRYEHSLETAPIPPTVSGYHDPVYDAEVPGIKP